MGAALEGAAPRGARARALNDAGGPGEVVGAAGGVVVRAERPGAWEVAVVHRPRYDDWSLPKGKLLQGETEPECALREVEEETGLRCALGRFLGTLEYRDRHGRRKIVHYWLMEPLAGAFRATREIDRLRWLPPVRAAELLTYERERALLDGLAHQGLWTGELTEEHDEGGRQRAAGERPPP